MARWGGVMGHHGASGAGGRDAMIWKRALKSWFVRMPFRPQIKFFYLYMLCRGFLDGKPGWGYCRMQAVYEAMIEVKRASHGAHKGHKAPVW